MSLDGDNMIINLGSFSAPGHTFGLNNDIDLTLQGTIIAKSVVIRDGASITIDPGAGFAGLGGGTGTPSHAPVPGNPGLYLQAGNITNASPSLNIAGAPSVDVTFALTGSGVVNLGYFRQPNVQLFLDLTNGVATGQIGVAGFTLDYGPATKSIVNLLGSVRGLSGASASLVSFILPLPLDNYQINGYPISIGNLPAVASTSINGSPISISDLPAVASTSINGSPISISDLPVVASTGINGSPISIGNLLAFESNSINGLQNFRDLTSLPITNSLEDVQFGGMEQQSNDDDTSLPDVADKDY